jgi:aryl-alcohol dehydrogenase-like predicted oxidoreductase
MTPTPLDKRRLGRTGLMVSPLSLGGAHLGETPDSVSDDLAVRTVHAALHAGLNLIDTAPMYGDSQRRIGLALRDWLGGDHRREDLVLSTKTGRDPQGGRHYSAAETHRSVHESLRLLQTPYLDIVLVHDPDDPAPVFDPGGTLEALSELKAEGLIRAIGVGVRSHDFHRRCIRSGAFDVCLTFCDYNLLDQSAADSLLDEAAAHDVGLLNGAAVMLGLLGGGDPRLAHSHLATPERVERATDLWQWARSGGVSLEALNLQLCLRETRLASTLVGVADPEELHRDLQAIAEPIPDEVWTELSERFGIHV